MKCPFELAASSQK